MSATGKMLDEAQAETARVITVVERALETGLRLGLPLREVAARIRAEMKPIIPCYDVLYGDEQDGDVWECSLPIGHEGMHEDVDNSHKWGNDNPRREALMGGDKT